MSVTSTGVEVDHLTPAIGTVVRDLDLGAPDISERHGAMLRELLAEREVLFFRHQVITPEEQVRFGEIFGTVRDGGVEIAEGDGPAATGVWQADGAWSRHAPLAACLYAVNVPPAGGDTVFASMTAAFASLDSGLQTRLARLTAMHEGEDADSTFARIEQPVVAVHPRTLKLVLNVDARSTTHIAGLSRDESQHLLAYLTGLARVPEWQVRFRWQRGSVAVWDNRAVQYYNVNDYHPEPRLMHRVTVI